MEYDAIEVSRFLTNFKPLIHKTLQRLNIKKHHMDYEDYYQELQIKLLSIRRAYKPNKEVADAETERFIFTAYASRGLYWHGLNLIKKNSQSAHYPLEEEDLEWLSHQQQSSLSKQSHIALEDFFQQAKKRLTDEDYLLLLYLSDEQYDIETIAELMQVSRSTIFQRKKRIQVRLENIKNCLKE